ncbi:MAG TPA: glycosyltransferase [Candidatus Acidoferrum sp.]
MAPVAFIPPGISAIVPARNEEEVIAVCVASLTQQGEISEVIVVDDQSSDRTAEILAGLTTKYPQLRLLKTEELPAGWVGKNNAVWLGAQAATGDWLLFTDADAMHSANSARRALEIAREHDAALVSFSPEQMMETWYEKAMIPYVYCRLARLFSYDDVNNPQKSAAAANGQFVMIRRDAYEAVGGHASVAGEILEDVALAKRIKQAGYRLWFGSGRGIVRVRMYRTFRSMWQGWKKNLYQLIGREPMAYRREVGTALFPVLGMLVAAISVAAFTESVLAGVAALVVSIVAIQLVYARELRCNSYPASLTVYGITGRILYAAVLWASYRGYRKGKLQWKDREYPVGTPDASK